MYAYVYILRCSDGSFYTGSTSKYIFDRVAEHNQGSGANYTSKRLPVELVYFEEYGSLVIAFSREKQIQGWSRKKKIALINGTPELLPKLSKNYTQFGKPE